MRRWIAGAAAGLGLLLAAPAAQADGPQWSGSRISTDTSTSSESFVLAAQFFRSTNNLGGGTFSATTSFTTPTGLPPACGAPGTVAVTTSWQGNTNEQPWNTTAPHSVDCNGTYSFEVTATFKPSLSAADVKKLPGTITISAPPPNVEGVTAELQDGKVVLTWSKLSDQPGDFTGWRVERQSAGGDYETIGTLGPGSERTFTDSTPPPTGGEVVYRVRATRSGPSGDVASEGGGRRSIDLPVVTTTSTPGATDSGATDGGTAGTGGTEGADGGTTATTVKSSPRFNSGRGRTGVGIPAPRLGQSTGSGLLMEPLDDGFEEEIDYGELPGEEAGAGDDLEIFDEGGGRGLAVPIGIGAVLLGWGLHLFFLARAARPETMAVPVLAETYDDPVDDDLAYDDPVYDDEPPSHWPGSYETSGSGTSTGYGTGSYGTRYPSAGTRYPSAGTRYPSSSTYSSFSAFDDD